MSHELRTPLNAIIGFSDMIRHQTFGPVGNDKYLEYVRDIHKSGEHLLQLINDILDLSKVEAGKLDLYEEEIDMAEVVRSCMVMVKERAEGADLKLVMQVPDGLPLLRADKCKLKQILINLLSNSVKFTLPGGEVRVRAWCDADSGYVLQVADNGIGIAPKDIPVVTMPFRQADSGLNRRYEGTGLGLPLTRLLVELHGGSLELASEVEVGTTVTARFPPGRIVAQKPRRKSA
jgi:signal transduction histidine kinase